MNIRALSFTPDGIALSARIAEAFAAEGVDSFVAETRYKGAAVSGEIAGSDYSSRIEEAEAATGGIRYAEEGLTAWTEAAMRDSDAVLFIGATGIAVRAIAPFVRDKLADPAVLVMDEQGTYVIPLLSGHVGGGNALAARIADFVGALPVITTATDLRGDFSADLFAKEHNLRIVNREGIARVSTRAIEGKPVRLLIEGFPGGSPDVVVTTHPALFRGDALILCPRRYALGVGCKRGTSCDALASAIEDAMKRAGIDQSEAGAISSIDVKAEEPGLIELCRKWRLPFLTFTAEVLRSIPGDFTPSEFVESRVGVDNVCERAAMAAVGQDGRLILKKQKYSGITVAIAEVCA